MSIILDALRKGRGRQTTGPNPNTAQTDAVLRTLGYGRFNAPTPFTRLKRVLAYLAIGILLAILLWATVLWLTRAFSSSTSTPESAVSMVTLSTLEKESGHGLEDEAGHRTEALTQYRAFLQYGAASHPT